MYNDNRFKSRWVDEVFKILNVNGLGYIWYNQTAELNVNYVKNIVKISLVNQFEQNWNATIQNSSKCTLYRSHKTKLEFENYLVNIPQYFVKYIIKFRTSNHKLAIETGRYLNIARGERHCDLCEARKLGDEFHLLFECMNNNVCEARRKFIPVYYTQNPSVYKYSKLMCDIVNKNTGIQFAKFIKACNII